MVSSMVDSIQGRTLTVRSGTFTKVPGALPNGDAALDIYAPNTGPTTNRSNYYATDRGSGIMGTYGLVYGSDWSINFWLRHFTAFTSHSYAGIFSFLTEDSLLSATSYTGIRPIGFSPTILRLENFTENSGNNINFTEGVDNTDAWHMITVRYDASIGTHGQLSVATDGEIHDTRAAASWTTGATEFSIGAGNSAFTVSDSAVCASAASSEVAALHYQIGEIATFDRLLTEWDMARLILAMNA